MKSESGFSFAIASQPFQLVMVIFSVVDTFNLHYSHLLQAGSNIREMLQGDVKGRIYSTDHGIRQSHFQVKFSISGLPDILIHLLPLLRRILAILHLIRSVDKSLL